MYISLKPSLWIFYQDGTQGESVCLSCDDKLKIASKLSSFNVDYIEAGWPGSNPKDAEFFSRAKVELSPMTRSKLVAFGSTRRKNIDAKDDPQIQKLVESGAGTICMVAKGHLWQVKEIICAKPEENLKMIEDSVSYLVNLGKTVFVDLEHFFDGYKFDKEYSLKCCKAAVGAGASGLVLCDTNGGSMPWEVGTITADIVAEFSNVTVGIHAHNDCGMAIANSVVAAKNGAGLVQGTINGIGERTGNADLCSIIPTLALHVRSKVSCMENLCNITSLSRFVDETMNRQPNSAAPFVGASAFAHKGGLHVAAMERSPKSYQHIDPGLVGNEKRVLISELSGRQNIMGKVKDLGGYADNLISDDVASERALAILNRVKHLESIGYTFEGAEASVDIMILHATKGYCRPFTVLDYAAQVFETNLVPELRNLSFDPRMDGGKHKYGATARATVTVRTIDVLETVSNNNLYICL
jgi:Isopropylmalate/homocitrate/citramalate synthases